MSSEEEKRVQGKTGRRKTITAIPPRTASIYNRQFKSHREGEDEMLNHMSVVLPFISMRRIQ